jgi:hypothetical protein
MILFEVCLFNKLCSLTQAYMSALTSSIQVLEQQVGRANDTSASLSSSLSQAFGDDSLQRDSQLDVQVMQLYQVRPAVAATVLLLAHVLFTKAVLPPHLPVSGSSPDSLSETDMYSALT